MKVKPWLGIIIAFLLAVSLPAAGAETLTPLETIKGPINRIMELLNDTAYNVPEKKHDQRDKIWEAAKPLFDFDEISRRTVGKDWQRFTDSERERFTAVFSEFLGNTYIDKIQGEYHNEKIAFVSELVRDDIALARTKLMRESIEIPIDYRMRRKDGVWRVYDILVENGVSLVKNYRVQFVSILQKETPAQLITRLEQKLEEQKAVSN